MKSHQEKHHHHRKHLLGKGRASGLHEIQEIIKIPGIKLADLEPGLTYVMVVPTMALSFAALQNLDSKFRQLNLRVVILMMDKIPDFYKVVG